MLVLSEATSPQYGGTDDIEVNPAAGMAFLTYACRSRFSLHTFWLALLAQQAALLKRLTCASAFPSGYEGKHGRTSKEPHTHQGVCKVCTLCVHDVCKASTPDSRTRGVCKVCAQEACTQLHQTADALKCAVYSQSQELHTVMGAHTGRATGAGYICRNEQTGMHLGLLSTEF